MRIGMLTAGGDCPGLNAVIRAIARSAMLQGDEAVGICRGYRGLAENDYMPLGMSQVTGILHQGGTILGTSSYEPIRENAVDEVATAFEKQRFDAVIAIGGEHTMEITRQLHAERGLPLVGSRRRSTTMSAAPTSPSASTPRCRWRPTRSTASTPPPSHTTGSWWSR